MTSMTTTRSTDTQHTSPDSSPKTPVVPSIRRLFETLDGSGIRWAHWKSNQALDRVLSGDTDIDLLVDRRHVGSFEAVLGTAGFKRGERAPWEDEPAVFHFFGLDEDGGRLIHVHVYYRVFTGGSLLKNFHLPVEEMLLANLRRLDGVSVPTPSADYLVFVLRKMVEHGNLAELLLLRREGDGVSHEIEWLAAQADRDEMDALLARWLPSVDRNLFRDCERALRESTSLIGRIRLGKRLRAALRGCSRFGALRATVVSYGRFARKLLRRVVGGRSRQRLAAGGSVVAIVGPEATGKTTTHRELRAWLGEHFAVDSVHAGRPPHTLLTLAPGLLLPALRRLLPRCRSSSVEASIQTQPSAPDPSSSQPVTGLRLMLFALRSALLARERAALLLRAHRRAATGSIVIADRYPTRLVGAMDSPQVLPELLPTSRWSIARFFGRQEAALYARIPPPDVVSRLTVPVAGAGELNATRLKKGNEDEAYVRRRHAIAASLQYDTPHHFEIDTNRSLDATLREIKTLLWSSL